MISDFERPAFPEREVYVDGGVTGKSVNQCLSEKGRDCTYEDVSDGGVSYWGLTEYGFWYLVPIVFREFLRPTEEAEEFMDTHYECFCFFTNILAEYQVKEMKSQLMLLSSTERMTILNALLDYIDFREPEFPWKADSWIQFLIEIWAPDETQSE